MVSLQYWPFIGQLDSSYQLYQYNLSHIGSFHMGINIDMRQYFKCCPRPFLWYDMTGQELI